MDWEREVPNSREGSYYRPSAICRRGHVVTDDAEQFSWTPRCSTCGTDVLVACPECRFRLRGHHWIPGFFGASPTERPDFCDRCGGPFPWLSRQGRFFLLHNQLDQADLDEATALRVRELLDQISEYPDSSEQQKWWTTIKAKAPGFLEQAGVRTIVVSVVGEALKKQLGL